MTEGQAIDWCEQLTDNLVMVNVDTKKRTLGLQAMQVCKSALEKQIPKKPIDDRYPWCICPVCGGSVYLKNVQEHIMNLETTHCEHCGQALDWSDTNDT
jgi:hypothetical protein